MPSTVQPELFETDDFLSFVRLQQVGTYRDVPSFVLDVPETIPQLGYGSHQFFRYYGKFPSVVGAEIVRRHARDGQGVLDCYAGSGTTMVEAQSAGHASFGIDINPLAVLASNVKTSYPDVAGLRAALSRVVARAREGGHLDDRLPSSITAARIDKWFRPEVQIELVALREALQKEALGLERAFLLTAFLGVVRRVSNAYDGEVRPHINPDKKPRSPLVAFARKANEMIDAMREVNSLRPQGLPGTCILGDNRDLGAYETALDGAEVGLVVAHPPYLNSFNYLQVFSLELAWAQDFAELWGDFDRKSIRAAEHQAWPATNEKLKDAYYADFRSTMSESVRAATERARIVVVIGDATIRGELEPVHTLFWDALVEIGLRPVEVWFRTTHYGIGKYAYRHRADYHGEEAEKRDAVLIFEKG